MCARWPATWAATSAASAISPSCAGSRSIRSPPTISSRSRSWKPRACPPSAEAKRADRDRFAAIDAYLVETAAALECLPQVAVTDDAASRIRLGNAVIVRGRDAPVEAEEACATARGRLVAIGAIEAGMFKPKRVFAG